MSPSIPRATPALLLTPHSLLRSSTPSPRSPRSAPALRSLRSAHALPLASLLALLLLCLARPAAACSKRHETPFELLVDATHVAEVRVTATPPPRGAGFAELRVLRTIKGPRRRTLRGAETNTSCHVGYRVGRRALVFLGPRGETRGSYEGYLELRADDPLLRAVRAYAAAADDRARADALVDAIVAGPRPVADEAATFLALRPDLLAAVDIPARERLFAAHLADVRDGPLLVVLARLGHDFTAPPPGRLRPVWADLAALLRPRDDLEDLAVDALADRIAASPDVHDPHRIRAMDRCERLHARLLFPVFSYGHGGSPQLWPKLADACRKGQAVSW